MVMWMRILQGFGSSAALLSMSFAGTAWAQTAEQNSSKNVALEEILVTATRHEEGISKVPVSVTAFGQEAMDLKGIKDIQDVVRFTPGIAIDNTGTNTVAIRGISSSGGAGTTGIYIDDTPIQIRSISFNSEDTLPKTFDLERVEVLRGPQGTLFGAGSEGGTVRYILAQPSITSASTYARSEVSYTEHGAASYEAGIAKGGPLVDGVLGVRASAWYRRDGGWIDRVDPFSRQPVDSNSNRVSTAVLRLAALWQPASNVSVTPSIVYQNSQRHDQSTFWQSYSDVEHGQFNNAYPGRNPVSDRFALPALKVEVGLGKATLISNTSYYNRREVTGYDGTTYNLSFYQQFGWPAAANAFGVYVPFLDPNVYPLVSDRGINLPAALQGYRSNSTVTNLQNTFTQELRVQSQDPSSRWRWTVGAFYSRSRQKSVVEQYDPNLNQLLQGLFGVNVADLFFGFDLLPNGDSYYGRVDSTEWQLAGFGELTYGITDKLQMTLGGRVSKTSFDLKQSADGPPNYGPSSSVAGQSETPVTPKLSLSYQATPNHLLYATYAKGFRPGGGNSPLPSTCGPSLDALGYANGEAPLKYDSDTTQSYEIGSKNNLGNVIRIASSVYYIRWNGIQQNLFLPGCGFQFTDNLGTAVSKGFDLQAESTLGTHFKADLALGYTNARYVKDSRGGLALSGNAVSGATASGAVGTSPPWTVALGIEYFINGTREGPYARIDYQYQSRNPWLAPPQDPKSSQYNPYVYTLSATKFVSLRSGTSFGPWGISFFVDNLFNTHTTTNYGIWGINPYYPGAAPVPPAYNNFSFRPRTFGLTATYRQ